MKHYERIHFEEERTYLVYTAISLFIKRSQNRNANRAGTWRKELIKKPGSHAAHWLASHGLLILLPYRTQDHLSRDGPTNNGLGLLPSIADLVNALKISQTGYSYGDMF